MKLTLTYGSKCRENKAILKHFYTKTDSLNKICLIFYLFYNEQSSKKMLVDDRHNQMMSSSQLLVDIPTKRYINELARLHLWFVWSVNNLWWKDVFYHFLKNIAVNNSFFPYFEKGFMHILTERFVWKSSNIFTLFNKISADHWLQCKFQGTIYLYNKPLEWYQE